MTRRDLDYGEVVPLSYWKNAKTFSMGVFALIPSGFAFWFGGTLFLDRNARDLHWAVMLLLSLMFSCAGLAFLALAAYLVWRAVTHVWRQDRLFLGKHELLCVARDGKVLTRIPYDNIEEVTLMEEEGAFHGAPVFKVGINVVAPRREDTVLLATSPLDPAGEEDVSALIGDFYGLSPQQIYKKLVRRWEKARSSGGWE